jgi:hypothetical protein
MALHPSAHCRGSRAGSTRPIPYSPTPAPPPPPPRPHHVPPCPDAPVYLRARSCSPSCSSLGLADPPWPVCGPRYYSSPGARVYGHHLPLLHSYSSCSSDGGSTSTHVGCALSRSHLSIVFFLPRACMGSSSPLVEDPLVGGRRDLHSADIVGTGEGQS